MKKALLLIGSPRKNGSTAILAAETERALKDQGVATETVFLNDLKIKGCRPATGARRTMLRTVP
jgi:multimeric flavodoxin WrbA